MAIIAKGQTIPKHILDAATKDKFEILPYQQAFLDSLNWLEEILLAAMAAGVPKSCIRVVPPYQRKLHFGNFGITTEIQFVGKVN